MKELLSPFGEVNKKIKTTITVFWIVFFLALFEVFHSPIIPPPSKILESLLQSIDSREFYDDLIASLTTTLKAMGYSIILTMIIVYMSRLPLFSSWAQFVSKCRYLTLTGLVFVFTFLSSNIGELKIKLLIFGIVPFFVTSFLSIVEDTPSQEIEKGYVNKLTRWQTLYEVIIIGKMNQLVEVMRQNFAISWMMITTVEGYAMSEGGVGTMLIKSNKYLNLAPVFSTLIIVFSMGMLFDWGLSQLRYLLFPYLKSEK